MKVYAVHRRWAKIAQLTFVLVFISIWCVGFSAGGFWFIGVPFATLFMTVWCWSALREICEIRLADDGVVTFRRLRGSVTIPLARIYEVTGVRNVDEYRNVSWKMQVRTMHETFTVEFFDRAMEFAGDLRTLKPSLPVNGEWPVLNPWDLQLTHVSRPE